LAGLAICPGGDIDVFRLRVDVVGKNLRADIANTKAQGELVAEILDGGGVMIATGAYTTDVLLRVELDNAPTGTYHVQVRGADTTIRNNYSIDITTTGP
jgi:hypothetical protein